MFAILYEKKSIVIKAHKAYSIDNHGSGYLGMAGCFSVQGKKWSKLTNFQPTLSWFKTVSGSNQLYQLLLQSSLSQNIKLQHAKPFMYTTASI